MIRSIFLLVAMFPFDSLGQEALFVMTSGDSVRTKINGLSVKVVYSGAGNFSTSDIKLLVLTKEEDVKGLIKSTFNGRIKTDSSILRLAKTAYEPEEPAVPHYDDWLIEDREAVWRHVYRVTGDSAFLNKAIIAKLRRYSYMNLVGDQAMGNFNDWVIDYKKNGGGGMSTPYIFRVGKWSGSFTVDFKDNRYRVTVSNITVDAGTMTYGDWIKVSNSSVYIWTATVLTKDHTAFRSGQLSNVSFLSKAIRDIFELTVATKKKDDW